MLINKACKKLVQLLLPESEIESRGEKLARSICEKNLDREIAWRQTRVRRILGKVVDVTPLDRLATHIWSCRRTLDDDDDGLARREQWQQEQIDIDNAAKAAGTYWANAGPPPEDPNAHDWTAPLPSRDLMRLSLKWYDLEANECLLDKRIHSDFLYRFVAHPRNTNVLPSKVQQGLAQYMLNLMETACFQYVQRQKPSWLRILDLESADALELEFWFHLIRGLPYEDRDLDIDLHMDHTLADIRHIAVHRRAVDSRKVLLAMRFLLSMGEVEKARQLEMVVRFTHFEGTDEIYPYHLSRHDRIVAGECLKLFDMHPTTYHGILLTVQSLLEQIIASLYPSLEGNEWRSLEEFIGHSAAFDTEEQETSFRDKLQDARRLRNAQAHRNEGPYLESMAQLLEMLKTGQFPNTFRRPLDAELDAAAKHIRSLIDLEHRLRDRSDEGYLLRRRLEREREGPESTCTTLMAAQSSTRNVSCDTSMKGEDRNDDPEANVEVDFWRDLYQQATSFSTTSIYDMSRCGSFCRIRHHELSHKLWPRLVANRERFLRLSGYDRETDRWPDGVRLHEPEEYHAEDQVQINLKLEEAQELKQAQADFEREQKETEEKRKREAREAKLFKNRLKKLMWIGREDD